MMDVTGMATANIHCPECGASTRFDRDQDGWEYAICTNDDCPKIVVEVLSKPRESERPA